MYVEQLRWLSAIPCPKPIHLPPTHFAFLEEGVFLAKMIKYKVYQSNKYVAELAKRRVQGI
ncbi:hypothetical protein CN587_18805 [Bacillus wiedmannii]|nr:hypothetical protein CN587_18805 [Bacillus wiedmannii]PHC86989.1 hypothetical protein COF42_16105 [Bacillus wiedmannii]PHD20156.1 hypothetical protein COF58_26975 [Bacillus wiedmannii]